MKPSDKKLTLAALFSDVRMAMEEVLWRRPQAWILQSRARLKNLPKTNFDMGVQFAAEGKLFDAAFRFRMVLMLDKTYPQAWQQLGSCYFRMGRQKEAAEALAQAYRLDPTHLHTTLMLASVAPELIPASERPTSMPKEMIVPFFEGAAAQYDITESAAGYQAGALIYALAKPLLAVAAPEVIDLGCGTGIASRPWRAEAARITGVDLTPAMLAFADKAAQGEKKLFDQLMLADLAAPMNLRADVVLMVNVAQYVGDLRAPLHAVAGALNPEGVVVVTLEPYAGKSGFGLSADTGRFGHDPAYVKEVAHRAGLVLAKESALELYPGQPQQTLVFRKE